jgi:hypothetical protein
MDKKNVRLTPIAPDSYPHSTLVVAYAECHTFVLLSSKVMHSSPYMSTIGFRAIFLYTMNLQPVNKAHESVEVSLHGRKRTRRERERKPVAPILQDRIGILLEP